jgi:hypothetical protein
VQHTLVLAMRLKKKSREQMCFLRCVVCAPSLSPIPDIQCTSGPAMTAHGSMEIVILMQHTWVSASEVCLTADRYTPLYVSLQVYEATWYDNLLSAITVEKVNSIYHTPMSYFVFC